MRVIALKRSSGYEQAGAELIFICAYYVSHSPANVWGCTNGIYFRVHQGFSLLSQLVNLVILMNLGLKVSLISDRRQSVSIFNDSLNYYLGYHNCRTLLGFGELAL